jgi:hypothetical protein
MPYFSDTSFNNVSNFIIPILMKAPDEMPGAFSFAAIAPFSSAGYGR